MPCSELPQAMEECDYFLTQWPRLSLCSAVLSAQQNTVRSLPSFVFPATLIRSTLLIRFSSPPFPLLPPSHARSLPPSLPSSRPFSLWQTAGCPFLCLLCWRSLIRKINKKKTPSGWKDRGLSSEWITISHWEKPWCDKNIWIWGFNRIVIYKCCVRL